MLLSVGTKVRLVNTGDEGEVTQVLQNGMAMVFVYDIDMDIPVSMDDMVRQEDYQKIEAKKQEQKKQGPSLQEVPGSSGNPIKSEGTNSGIHLAFKAEGTHTNYTIYLINDSLYSLNFTFKLFLNQFPVQELSHQIPPFDYTPIGELNHDQLNDSPEVEFSIQTPEISNRIKIKAKRFFSSLQQAPLIQMPMHLFRDLINISASSLTESKDDIRKYTELNMPSKTSYRNPKQNYNIGDLYEKVNFNTEIDLHIEKLTDSYHKLSNAQILSIQMRTFENYLSEAIYLGIKRVYIIHGKGKGILRDKIGAKLQKNDSVLDFANEYHPKYGFGATEVILGY